MFGRWSRKSAEIESIDSREAMDQLFEASHQQPVWILKHSTACGVSFEALRQYKRYAKQVSEEGAEEAEDSSAAQTFAMVKIREHRDLSNALAERTGIRHESPQLFLLDHGEVVWHADHWAITAAALGEALAKPSD